MIVKKLNSLILNNNEKRQENFYFSPSRAGMCKRMMYFEIINKNKAITDSKMSRIFLDGHNAETTTIEILKKAGIEINNNQLPVNIAIPKSININSNLLLKYCPICENNIEDNTLHGHIDGIYNFQENGINYSGLFEHKAINHDSFNTYIKQGISDNYIKQVSLYLRGLEITNAIILAKNKNNAEYLECHIKYDLDSDTAILVKQIHTNSNENIEKIFNKEYTNIVYDVLIDFQTVSESIESKTIPFKDNYYWNTCALYCNFFEDCAEQFNTNEKNLMSKTTIDNFNPYSMKKEDFKKMIDEYRIIKKNIDENKKIIDEIKINILNEMLNKKTKKIQGEDFDIIYFTKEINKEEIDKEKLKNYLGKDYYNFIINQEINIQEVLWIKEK